MYRVIKALNHNAVLALESGTNAEYLIMGKGIGFGKKVSERIEPGEDSVIYSLQSVSKRGKAKELFQEQEKGINAKEEQKDTDCPAPMMFKTFAGSIFNKLANSQDHTTSF